MEGKEAFAPLDTSLENPRAKCPSAHKPSPYRSSPSELSKAFIDCRESKMKHKCEIINKLLLFSILGIDVGKSSHPSSRPSSQVFHVASEARTLNSGVQYALL